MESERGANVSANVFRGKRMKSIRGLVMNVRTAVHSASRRTLACGAAAGAVILAMAGSALALPACPVSISKCCIANQAGKTYSLGADILAADECIDISAPNVFLNLDGHTITGPGFAIGLHVLSSAPNATIFPGVIQKFATGFQTDAPNTIEYVVEAVLNERGFFFNGPAAFAVPIAVENVHNGIVLTAAASGSVVWQATSASNGGNGIVLNGTSGVTLWNPTAAANVGYGLWLKGASFNSVIGGDIEENTIAGAYLGCHGGGPSPAPCTIPPSSNNTFMTGGSGAPLTVGSGCNKPNSQPYGIAIDKGNGRNHVFAVVTDNACSGSADTIFDAYDGNGAACMANLWFDNIFVTKNHTPSASHLFCID
jgi:hypothetical protein